MATAIHREHFLVTMLKKEISTPKELDLRPLGKVIIFRVKQNLPIIYRWYNDCGDDDNDFFDDNEGDDDDDVKRLSCSMPGVQP